MASMHTAITNALAAAINGHTWSKSFTAYVGFGDWDDDLKNLGTLRCDVVGTAKSDDSIDATNSLEQEIVVSVGLRYKFGPTDRETDGRIKASVVQPYVDLLDEIKKYFLPNATNLGRPFASLPTVAVAPSRSIETVYHYHPRHMRELGQYTGLIRFRFAVSESL